MYSIFKYIPALFKKIIPSQLYTGWVFRNRNKEGYFALHGDKFVFGIDNDEGELRADGSGTLFLANDGTYKAVAGTGGFDYRSGSASLSTGSTTINFSSPLANDDYTVIVKAYDVNGNEAVSILGAQTASGFNVTLFFAGTVRYIALPNR